jgi:cell division septum initiation protein DivIVA
MAEELEALKTENAELKAKVAELEERIKKYSNGENHKRYYEKNKEIIKAKGSENLKKLKETNPEKLREYRRNYYLKRKERLTVEKDSSATPTA